MAITIQSTAEAASHGVKALVYGASGSGKTRLAATLPGTTLILSAEAGLLSLREYDLPAITINSIKDLEEAFDYCSGPDGKGIDNLVLDSLSEIAEQILENEKATVKDGRLAYAALGEKVISIAKGFRDLQGKNVIMIAKVERMKDELSGGLLFTPSFPGSKLAGNLPYYFDEVFYLRVEKDGDGNSSRWIQTQQDNQIIAKDRSGVLDQFEPADLGAIINKIAATSAKPAKKGK